MQTECPVSPGTVCLTEMDVREPASEKELNSFHESGFVFMKLESPNKRPSEGLSQKFQSGKAVKDHGSKLSILQMRKLRPRNESELSPVTESQPRMESEQGRAHSGRGCPATPGLGLGRLSCPGLCLQVLSRVGYPGSPSLRKSPPPIGPRPPGAARERLPRPTRAGAGPRARREPGLRPQAGRGLPGGRAARIWAPAAAQPRGRAPRAAHTRRPRTLTARAHSPSPPPPPADAEGRGLRSPSAPQPPAPAPRPARRTPRSRPRPGRPAPSPHREGPRG